MERPSGRQLTKRFEGYREAIYLDSLGNPTGGYGTHLFTGRKVPKYIWEALFEHDYRQAEIQYEKLDIDLNPIRRAVMIDLIYNMGINKLLKFNRMLKSLRSGDFELASAHLINSKYAQQVGERAVENAEMLCNGE